MENRIGQPPSDGCLYVCEDDGHNYPSIHKFRDQEHFFTYLTESFGDDDETEEMKEDWEENSEFTDSNGDRWYVFTGNYLHDHTKEGT